MANTVQILRVGNDGLSELEDRFALGIALHGDPRLAARIVEQDAEWGEQKASLDSIKKQVDKYKLEVAIEEAEAREKVGKVWVLTKLRDLYDDPETDPSVRLQILKTAISLNGMDEVQKKKEDERPLKVIVGIDPDQAGVGKKEELKEPVKRIIIPESGGD